jgi:hypothetical protein
MANPRPTCSGCGIPQPEWPADWLALDDGRHYCPPCRKNVYLLRSMGFDIGGTGTDDSTAHDLTPDHRDDD